MKRPIQWAILAMAASVSLVFGQSPAAAPSAPSSVVDLRRGPIGQGAPQAQGQLPPLLQKYDFGAQLRILQDPTAVDPQKMVGPITASVATSASAGTDGKNPKSYQPRTDLPLSSTAIEAVRVSETWRAGHDTPTTGPDGRVLYAFGAGLPIVVCAPLRVCTIELQQGERVTGEPQIGDSVRWNISPTIYGQGEGTTSVIVLKPQESGLDTNLLITTDRRAYYLRLVSKPQEYVARVAFSYPEQDNSQKWQQHLLAQRAQTEESKRAPQLMPAMITAAQLNFDYKVAGGTELIRPVRVFDDGAKTYIQMRTDIQNREAPVLVVLGSDGKGEMTNYRVQQQTYIVDRIFEHARLILGAGKKAQKVEITREQHPIG